MNQPLPGLTDLATLQPKKRLLLPRREGEKEKASTRGPSAPNVSITPPPESLAPNTLPLVELKSLSIQKCSLNELAIYHSRLQTGQAPRSSCFLGQLFLARIYSEKLEVKSKSK